MKNAENNFSKNSSGKNESLASSLMTSSMSLSTMTTTKTTTTKSISVVNLVNDDEAEDIYEDASSDISILQKCDADGASKVNKNSDEAAFKLRKAKNQNLCVIQKKIQEPLYLRKCQLQRANIGAPPPNIQPLMGTQLISELRKNTSRSVLLTSLDSPTFCVRCLASNVKHRAHEVLIYQSPMCYAKFVARPALLETTHSTISDETETIKLFLSPERAIIAQKMLPKWLTVTFTLAYGRHMAVKYRIIEPRKQEIRSVKTKRGYGKRVSTRTLYRVEPIQRVEVWKSANPKMLKLSTVEKCDPQIVKKVFLDQKATKTISETSRQIQKITADRSSSLSSSSLSSSFPINNANKNNRKVGKVKKREKPEEIGTVWIRRKDAKYLK